MKSLRLVNDRRDMKGRKGHRGTGSRGRVVGKSLESKVQGSVKTDIFTCFAFPVRSSPDQGKRKKWFVSERVQEPSL